MRAKQSGAKAIGCRTFAWAKTTRAERPPFGRLGQNRPAVFAFTLCKASAPEFHQNKADLESKALGRCLAGHPEPRARCRLLRSQLPRIGLAASQRARPR